MATHIGKVTHYYNRISVAVVELSADLHIGDWVLFLGHSTDFSQPVSSMEIEHHPIQSAQAGQEIAVKVNERVRAGDELLKIKPAEDV